MICSSQVMEKYGNIGKLEKTQFQPNPHLTSIFCHLWGNSQNGTFSQMKIIWEIFIKELALFLKNNAVYIANI